jgi:hypothetical protein
MTLSTPSLRRFVRRALVAATATAARKPRQLAAAFDDLCERLQHQLIPLFGTTAVNALFVRAVHVANTDFPWLGDLLRNGQKTCAAEGIASLDQIDTDTLEEGLAAVLAHHIGLLNTFVGEDLVLPLVQQAWGMVDASRTESEL